MLTKTAAALALAAMSAMACAAGKNPEPPTLTVFADMKPLRAPFEEFTRQTGIKIVSVKGDNGKAPDADILFTSTTNAALEMQLEGKTRPYEPELQKLLDPRLRFNDFHALPIGYRARAFVFPKGQTPPATYADMAKPEYAGKICQIPYAHEYTQAWFGHLALSGVNLAEFAPAYHNNLAAAPAGYDMLQGKNIIGDKKCSLAVMNSYYYWNMLDRDDYRPFAAELRIAYPQDGALAMVNSASISKNTRHYKEANKLLAFLLSPLANQYIAESAHFYPASKDAFVPKVVETQVPDHKLIFREPRELLEASRAAKAILDALPPKEPPASAK